LLLASLPTLLTLALTRLVLSLAMLAALLLVFLHIVCHAHSSVLRGAGWRAATQFMIYLLRLPILSCHSRQQGWEQSFAVLSAGNPK
jgi:hypothetical protein